MGCSESKSSIAAGNTVTQNNKPAAADYPKKVEKEEDEVVQRGEAKAKENKGPGGDIGVDVKEGMQEATVMAEVEKKDDTVKEKPEKLHKRRSWKRRNRNRNQRKKMERIKLQRMRKAQPRKQNLHLRVGSNQMADAILPEEANPPPEKKEK